MSKIEVSIKADFTFKPTLGKIVRIVSELVIALGVALLAVTSYMNKMV